MEQSLNMLMQDALSARPPQGLSARSNNRHVVRRGLIDRAAAAACLEGVQGTMEARSDIDHRARAELFI